MNYSQLLDDYIKKSGLSLGEITKRLQEEKGIKIDRSYLSKLKNDPKYPASDEINRALAEITGGDPEELIWAAYYEKAPDEIKKLMDKKSELDTFYDYLKTKLSDTDNETTKLNGNEEFEQIIDGLVSLPKKDRDKLMGLLVNDFSIEEPEKLLSLAIKEGFEPNKRTDSFLLKKLREEANKTTKEMAQSLKMPEKSYKIIEAYWENDGIPEHEIIYNHLVGEFLADSPSNNQESNDTFASTLKRIPVFTFHKNGLKAVEECAFIEKELLDGKDAFALKVDDNSMSGDRIRGGDVVVIVEQDHVESQDIALVLVKMDDGEYVTLKRVKKQGDMCMLIPSNPSLEPILAKTKDIQILGKVVEVKFQPK